MVALGIGGFHRVLVDFVDFLVDSWYVSSYIASQWAQRCWWELIMRMSLSPPFENSLLRRRLLLYINCLLPSTHSRWETRIQDCNRDLSSMGHLIQWGFHLGHRQTLFPSTLHCVHGLPLPTVPVDLQLYERSQCSRSWSHCNTYVSYIQNCVPCWFCFVYWVASTFPVYLHVHLSFFEYLGKRTSSNRWDCSPASRCCASHFFVRYAYRLCFRWASCFLWLCAGRDYSAGTHRHNPSQVWWFFSWCACNC